MGSTAFSSELMGAWSLKLLKGMLGGNLEVKSNSCSKNELFGLLFTNNSSESETNNSSSRIINKSITTPKTPKRARLGPRQRARTRARMRRRRRLTIAVAESLTKVLLLPKLPKEQD